MIWTPTCSTIDDELTGLPVDQTFLNAPASENQHVHVTDALGTVLQTMNAGGGTATIYSYDPYGVTTTGGTQSKNVFQYAGRENDGTGLYYNRARYYNPAWGRFVSEDPLRFDGGVNFYEYGGNNSINLTDPTGLFGWGGAIVGAIYGGLEGIANGLAYYGGQTAARGCTSTSNAISDVAGGFALGALGGAIAGFGAPPGREAVAGTTVASEINVIAGLAGPAAALAGATAGETQNLINGSSNGGGAAGSGNGPATSPPTKPTSPPGSSADNGGNSAGGGLPSCG